MSGVFRLDLYYLERSTACLQPGGTLVGIEHPPGNTWEEDLRIARIVLYGASKRPETRDLRPVIASALLYGAPLCAVNVNGAHVLHRRDAALVCTQARTHEGNIVERRTHLLWY
eukprot:9312720-Pyramimonas_sp.AAC.1